MPLYVWFKKENVVQDMIAFFEKTMKDDKVAGSILLLGRSKGNEALLITTPFVGGFTCDVENMPRPSEYGRKGETFAASRIRKGKGKACDKS